MCVAMPLPIVAHRVLHHQSQNLSKHMLNTDTNLVSTPADSHIVHRPHDTASIIAESAGKYTSQFASEDFTSFVCVYAL